MERERLARLGDMRSGFHASEDLHASLTCGAAYAPLSNHRTVYPG